MNAASVSSSTLSEAASKELLSRFGIPFAREDLVDTAEQAVNAATAIGFPVVVKLNGDKIAHKTERGLVALNLASADAVRGAAESLLAKATPADGKVQLLVAQQVRGSRELIAGVADDPVFGRAVMLGVGGVLAEALADVVFRLIPIEAIDAAEMIDQLATQKLLGPFRGEPAVDRAALGAALVALSHAAQARPDIRSVDLNPLIVASSDGKPIAVDALVEVAS
jgi:acetate---CoA ligase (ADP-forming) subunit beta